MGWTGMMGWDGMGWMGRLVRQLLEVVGWTGICGRLRDSRLFVDVMGKRRKGKKLQTCRLAATERRGKTRTASAATPAVQPEEGRSERGALPGPGELLLRGVRCGCQKGPRREQR